MNQFRTILMEPYLGKSLWIWILFLVIITFLLLFDLGVLHHRNKRMTVRSSLMHSLFYVCIGIGFTGWIWYFLGKILAQEYLTAYLVEKSLSLDNIFVIALIFTYFKIPLAYQHRVLFLGIVGVLFLRALMIGAGSALLSRFDWMGYIFAAFLVITGFRILFLKEKKEDFGDNFIVKVCRKYLRVTPELHGDRFFVWLPRQEKEKNTNSIQKNRVWVTPLFLALILVEISDIMFAVDSIPAVFTITRDPYIVYTSNIFAILGLRSLYYSLAAILERFYYLKFSLSLILIFIGGKVFAVEWGHFPPLSSGASLCITILILSIGIVSSLLRRQFFKEN